MKTVLLKLFKSLLFNFLHKNKSSIITNDKKENLRAYHHKTVFPHMPPFEHLSVIQMEKNMISLSTLKTQ